MHIYMGFNAYGWIMSWLDLLESGVICKCVGTPSINQTSHADYPIASYGVMCISDHECALQLACSDTEMANCLAIAMIMLQSSAYYIMQIDQISCRECSPRLCTSISLSIIIRSAMSLYGMRCTIQSYEVQISAVVYNLHSVSGQCCILLP